MAQTDSNDNLNDSSNAVLESTTESKDTETITTNLIVKDMGSCLHLAWSVSFGYFLQMSLGIVSVFFVGKIATTEMAALALANMFCNVTGFSIGIGMASALDTLCAQAHTGSADAHASGKHLQRSFVLMVIISVFVAILWSVGEPVLLLLGQDAEISRLAGIYLRIMIPAIIPYFFFESMKRYLQSQNIMGGTLVVLLVVSPFNVFLQWLFIFGLDFGFAGAAIASCITYWTMPLLLVLYAWYYRSYISWGGFDSKEMFNKRLLWEYLKLGIAGVGLVTSEWWAFEIIALAAGLLGDKVLAAQSIILSTCGLAYMIPLGISIAAAAKIGNALGSFHPKTSQLNAYSSVLVGAVFAAFNAIFFLIVKDVWGYVWVNDPEVAAIVAYVFPLGAVFEFCDGLNCVLGGVLRGCGQQKIGAIINFVGYYVVGIPFGLYAAFSLDLGLLGLWLGLTAGLLVVSGSELFIILKMDWTKQAQNAKDRISLEADERTPLLGNSSE